MQKLNKNSFYKYIMQYYNEKVKKRNPEKPEKIKYRLIGEICRRKDSLPQ